MKPSGDHLDFPGILKTFGWTEDDFATAEGLGFPRFSRVAMRAGSREPRPTRYWNTTAVLAWRSRVQSLRIG
jgi:hypothetical protein